MKKSALLFAVTLFATSFAVPAFAQRVEVISAGMSIPVRTNDWINVRTADGRVYTGTVDADVTDERGNVAIPRGAQVELLVRRINNREMAIDLESIAVNGTRYAVTADNAEVATGRRDGVGGNERTAKYTGGGAILGTIIGALAGGGKGAAIGALAGGAAGASTQMATRGRAINVPAESVLTYRLEQPLVISERDRGYDRDGHHYHQDPYRPNGR